MNKSLYEVIGVSPFASTNEIEAKCLELGKKHHPDSNPNDLNAALIYKDVMLAYSTLRDSKKRATYDAGLQSLPTPNPGKVLSDARPNPQQSTYKPKKKVSGLHGLAILLVPYIAAWFTLKDGYSSTARVFSFTWMIIVLYIVIPTEPAVPLTPEQQVAYDAKREIREGVKRQQQQSEEFYKEQKTKSSRVMGAWKGAVKEILLDPDSANFKKVIFVNDVAGTTWACGEVNAKNRLGGFTGYKSFITAGLKEYTFLEGTTKGFNEYWNEICVNGKQI
jgi:curved DNA-binding protein CbpA